MRTEEEIRNRLENIRQYFAAGWFEDPSHAMFGASELLWALGFEEGSAQNFFEGETIYNEKDGKQYGWGFDVYM